VAARRPPARLAALQHRDYQLFFADFVVAGLASSMLGE
jgi:hypothetical protein